MRLGPVTRAAGPHALALLVVAGVGLVALSTPEGALFSRAYFGRELVSTQARLTLDEVTAAFILYHTVSWWLYFEDRVRRLRRTSAAEAVRLRRRVLAFHLVPFAINAALYLGLPSFHFYLAAPAYYLFWSALHVLHTAASRGLAPRPA
jgi:hypothetical protein